MGSLSSAKTLGGIGAILMLVGLFVFPIISIVGLILVYLGVKNISEATNDSKMRSDFLMSIILGIIAAILLLVGPIIALGGFSLGVTSFTSTDPMADLGAALTICAIIWIITVIVYILSAVYLKRSFDSVAKHTKVDMFKTTGLVYLIASILMIIVIGAFIMIIAYILMIVAFFSLPDTVPTGGASPGQSGRNCPGCGRPIPMDSQVCPYCGKDFRPK